MKHLLGSLCMQAVRNYVTLLAAVHGRLRGVNSSDAPWQDRLNVTGALGAPAKVLVEM